MLESADDQWRMPVTRGNFDNSCAVAGELDRLAGIGIRAGGGVESVAQWGSRRSNRGEFRDLRAGGLAAIILRVNHGTAQLRRLQLPPNSARKCRRNHDAHQENRQHGTPGCGGGLR